MDIEITEESAALLGEIMRLTALANIRHRGRWIYALRYDCGKWIHLTRRGYAYDGSTDIVARDTRATEENLREALAVLRDEIKSPKEKEFYEREEIRRETGSGARGRGAGPADGRAVRPA